MIRCSLLLAALVAIAGCGRTAPVPSRADAPVALLDRVATTGPCPTPCGCCPTPIVSPTITPTVPPSQGCTLVQQAAQFDNPQPPPWDTHVVTLYKSELDLYRQGANGPRRLAMQLNYGYATFDLTNPARPVLASNGWDDIHANPNYIKHGDGQSTVNAVQPSGDGQRLLVAYNDTHGTLSMPPSGNKWVFGGDFLPSWTSTGPGLAVLKNGSSYFGFSFPKGSLYVADISVPLTGQAAMVPGGIPRTQIGQAVVTSSARGLQGLVAGGHSYLVWNSPFSVVVGEVTFGPVISVSWRTLTVADLGYPAGSMLSSAVAETHPQTGELCVMTEGQGAGASSLGVNLVGIQPTLTRVIARFQPPTGSTVTPASALVAGTVDLMGLLWERDGSTGPLKLYGLSSGSWNRDLVGAASPAASGSVNLMRGYRDGPSVYVYYVSGPGALAAQMRCQ